MLPYQATIIPRSIQSQWSQIGIEFAISNLTSMDQSRSNTMNMVMEDGVEGFLSGRIAVKIKDQAFFSGSLLFSSWRLWRSFWGEYVSLLFTKVAPF